jgi:glycine/D-amino acid oxidase-like deaminating enzyme
MGRLDTGGRRVGRAIAFRFDGVPIAAVEGETLAAALTASGVASFRSLNGAPRGLHCGMGACRDCVVTVDGRIGVRACMEKARAGAVVTAAAPAMLAPLAAIPEGPAAEEACDVLVVGAGPAGIAAAIAAAEAGASVILLDERATPGGQFHKLPVAGGAGPTPDAKLREAARLHARAEAAGVRRLQNAMVWGAFAADEVAALVDGVARVFRPRRLILAPGAHEAPVPIPGWTLPGVITTGGLQTLVRSQRVAPTQPIVIGGAGALNLSVADELLAMGVAPAALVDTSPVAFRPRALGLLLADAALGVSGIGILARLTLGCVPLFWESRIEAVLGDGRAEAVRIATPSGPRVLPASTVALHEGFQPETGLARALDLRHRYVAAGGGRLETVTDAEGRSSDSAVFAVGDGAALGGSRVALAKGRLAGLAAARDLGFAAAPDAAARAALGRAERFQAALARVFPPPGAREPADETIVCRCESVTAGQLRAEVAGGLVSVAALKKATRAGMGPCQGRFCAATVARFCPGELGEDSFAAPRLPVRPVPAAALMVEAGEFEAPLIPAMSLPSRRVPVAPAAAQVAEAAIVVIGGGVVGLATAYFLARQGADVLVLERDEAGLAASTANAGSLHAQLISYDFDPDGPEDGGKAAHTLPLGPRSIALWKEVAAEAGEGLGISTPGGLVLAEKADDLPWLAKKSALERRWGVETHVIGANELRAMAPHLATDLAGAVFCPAEGRIDPLRGTMALRRLALARGARLRPGTEVLGIERTGSGFTIGTPAGPIRAGRVVNCAGPWGAAIGAMVGLSIPITGTVQQVIVTEPAPRLVEGLVALAHRHLSLKQQDAGGLLIGGGWFGRFDAHDGRSRNLRRSIEGNLFVAHRVLPALAGLRIIRAWTGVNPAIDRAPIFGEAPGVPGFFNTLTANGYTLGPVAGEITAAAVLRGEAPDANYRLERFG